MAKQVDAETHRRVIFVDTLMANVDNDKLPDDRFRQFVRNSLTQFKSSGLSRNRDNTSILDMELSVRARRILQGLGYETAGDIAKHTADELLGMRNLGESTLEEVRAALRKLGMRLPTAR
jgi:DNA-directed RNA polymerase alpha subunit